MAREDGGMDDIDDDENTLRSSLQGMLREKQYHDDSTGIIKYDQTSHAIAPSIFSLEDEETENRTF